MADKFIGFKVVHERTCHICKGSGRYPTDYDEYEYCYHCHGLGTVQTTDTVTIKYT